MIRRLKWWAWDSGKDFHPSPEETDSFVIGLVAGSIFAGVAFCLGMLVGNIVS